MSSEIVYLNKDSKIPIFGLDFIGIIDRGTNIVEIKPLTLCNLKCKYCFVKSGDYATNFIVDPYFLAEKVQNLIKYKGHHDIEVHIAPYGEIFLYKDLFHLLELLWSIDGIKTISMQTNGLLLSQKIIKNLENSNLTRINISLNTFDKKLAEYLTACNNYDIDSLKNNINLLLQSNIDILIAPVWFPGKNDEDIENIIKFVINLREKEYSYKKIQIGIQKYLVYKTGRKLKKIRPKSWGYFYQQLNQLEKKYNIKLKLGPHDFGIHERPISNINIQEGEIIPIKIVSKGRWKNEFIGKIDDNFSAKVLFNIPIEFSEKLIGKDLKVKVLNSSFRDSIITTYFPF